MGCDIHIVIQRQELDGTWREIPYQRVWWNLGHVPIDGVLVAPEEFTTRNYNLFGILANVRNGRGFAGCQTGDGWPSIAPDRGFPPGFDADAVASDPHYPNEGPRALGDHSYTWVGLDELRAFPWNAVVTKLYGIVPADEYENLLKTGDQPTSYSGGVYGHGIKVYEPSEYQFAKQTGTLVSRPYVRMSWDETARSATNDWPGQVIPWLEKLAEGKPLRLVLGFDS